MNQHPGDDDDLEEDEEYYFEDEDDDELAPDPSTEEVKYDEVLRVDPQTVLNLKSVVQVSGSIRLKKFGCKRSLMRIQAAARMSAPPHEILKRDTANETATYYQYIAGPNFKNIRKLKS